MLIRYALERLLYRLSQSDFRDQFVLKGAMHCQEDFREICRIPVEDDGLIFSADGAKRTQWRAFLRKSSLAAPDDFAIVNDTIQEFLMAPASAGREIAGIWPAGGPWQPRGEPGPQSIA